MSFSAVHSQVVACKYRGLAEEDYSFCSDHPSVGAPCNGFQLSNNRVSPRFAQCCRNDPLHTACACPFIQLDAILNPAEQCMAFMRGKCCMLGFANRLLKPSYDAWLDIQEALNKKCRDCPQRRLMRDCNAICCSAYTSHCYRSALEVLEDYPLDETVINDQEKATVLFRLLRYPLSSSLNMFGYACQGTKW